MGLLANLRRHGLLTVCAALALWVAQPALAALCPCVPAAVAEAAGGGPVAGAGDSGCCEGCCTPAAMARPAQGAAAPVAAACPLRDADFLACAVVPGMVDLAAKSPHSVPGVGFVESFRFPLSLPGPCLPGSDPEPPRALARMVATRCHPANAPPVS